MSTKKKRVKMRDIAERANVSLSTVSRVLNNSAVVSNDHRVAVEEAVTALNYRQNPLARALSSGQSWTVGVLTQTFGAPFYDTIMRGILQELEDTPYSPIFADGRWRADIEEKALQLLHNRHTDGVIIIGGQLSAETVTELGIPFVLVARHLPDLEDHCITVDNLMAAYEATRHLIEMGHRNIAHITAPRPSSTWVDDIQQRHEGYKKALEEAGIKYDPQLIIEGDLRQQSGMQAVEMLLMRGRSFSAVFAANDQMAMGARLALYRRGWRVPEDVSVIGFDDLGGIAFSIPPLTTVRQPAMEMGKKAAESILAQMKGEKAQSHHFPAELIIRESVQRYMQ